jgi:hypothetical protein
MKPETATKPERFFVAIENRLLLEGPEEGANPSDSREFLSNMAVLYNRQVEDRYPRMECRAAWQQWWKPEREFGKWLVMDNPFSDDTYKRLPLPLPLSILTQSDMSYVGSIQLKSPSFDVTQDSDLNWKIKVRRTWAFLYRNYSIKPDPNSHTYIQISMTRVIERRGGSMMDLEDIKRIAQCAIHFEPALQVLIPKHRRNDLDAMSNWVDNENFLMNGFSRRKVIAMIEACRSTREVIELMSPDKSLTPWMDQILFAWNFRSLYAYGSIEFRSAGTNLGSGRVFAWAELVLFFVQAALKIPSPESLRTVPANVGELKKFLGVDKIGNLARILDGHKDHESLQPRLTQFHGTRLEGPLQVRLDVDEELQRRLALGENI